MKIEKKSMIDEKDIFVQGETVDLIVPTRDFIERGDWHAWLNSPDINRYNNHGIFPINREMQNLYLENINIQRGNIVALLISKKDRKSVI